MKSEKTQLSDLGQQAFAAYKVIEYIRGLNPNYDRFCTPHTLSFKQELIDRHIIDTNVVKMKNFNKVMRTFTLKHSMDASVPFLDFEGDHRQNMENIQMREYYPTETTKTLFNVMLNRKRKSVILGNFGLTKNIAVYLLWHLSSFVVDYRILEEAKALQSFVDMDKFLSIPKMLYYELKDQEESKVIQCIRNQFLDIEFNWKKTNLLKFCQNLQDQNEQRGIRLFYILLSAQTRPDILLGQMIKIKSNGQHQSRIVSNAFKILSKDKLKLVRPEFLIKQQFGGVGLTYETDQFRTETRLGAGWRKLTYSVQKFAAIKQFCSNSNNVINFQRAYFLLRERQAYSQNSRKSRDRRKWKIKNIREIYKELCVLMHDEQSQFNYYEGQMELISKLAQEQSNTFTLLQSQFLQRSTMHNLTRNQNFIELQSMYQAHMFYFQTQHATNDLGFRLETMKKYLSLVINTKEEFVRQFRTMVHHLMSSYPQRFTLLLNGDALNIRAQHKSTFLPISPHKKVVNLQVHLSRLLPKISRYGKPPYYLSACSDVSNDTRCFNHVLLKWNEEEKFYDLKAIEWAFSDKIEDYWRQSSLKELGQESRPQDTIINDGNSFIPLVQKVIDLQKRIETDLTIRIEHFIICPQKIVDVLTANKQVKKFTMRGQRKWEITLVAIDDVRFTGFTFHEDNLASIMNQLLESITLAQEVIEDRKKK